MEKLLTLLAFLSITLIPQTFQSSEPQPNIEYMCEDEPISVDDILKEVDKVGIYKKIVYLTPYGPFSNRRDIADIVYRYSNEHNVDPNILLSIIRVESNFEPFARSSRGAMGLMQVMGLWKSTRECSNYNLYDMDQNVDCGTKIFLQYLKFADGNQKMAFTLYNRGPYAVLEAIKNGQSPHNTYPSEIFKFYNQLKQFDAGKNNI